MPGKIYYSERALKKDQKGPKYRVIAIYGLELNFVTEHVRLSELKHIAEDCKAELVHLRIGSKSEDKKDKEKKEEKES